MFKLALMLEMSWIYSIIITFKRTSLMMIMSTLYRWVKDFSALCTDYDVNVLETNRGYYMAAQRCEISLRVLKNISRVSAANKWNIFQHEKRTFVSPSGHVIFYLLGNSRKYPYPTTDGFHVLTPPCLRKFQNALPNFRRWLTTSSSAINHAFHSKN